MIEWIRQSCQVAPCPICKNVERQTLLLKVTSPTTGQKLDLYACSDCESLFYHPLMPIQPSKSAVDRYIQYYIEVGCGISSIIQPIAFLNIPAGVKKKFIDIGCGFGYAVDYASRELGWDAIGLEPSPIGVAAKSLLKAPIYNEYFENIPFLQSTEFDIMYTSEVLEHIDKPVAFLQMLRSRLATHGILVTATPNAEMVKPSTPNNLLMAILSPHWHTVLFSEKALRTLHNRLSFKYIEFARHGHQLVVHASDSPFELNRDATRTNLLYLEYLVNAASRFGVEGPLLIGFLSRAMDVAINANMLSLANSVGEKLAQTVHNTYMIDIFKKEDITARLEPLSTFEDIGMHMPYCLYSIYYLFGTVAMSENNHVKSAACFDLGFKVSKKFLEIGSHHFAGANNLLWRYRFLFGVSLCRSGKKEEGFGILKSILMAAQNSKNSCYSPPNDDLLNEIRAMFH